MELCNNQTIERQIIKINYKFFCNEDEGYWRYLANKKIIFTITKEEAIANKDTIYLKILRFGEIKKQAQMNRINKAIAKCIKGMECKIKIDIEMQLKNKNIVTISNKNKRGILFLKIQNPESPDPITEKYHIKTIEEFNLIAMRSKTLAKYHQELTQEQKDYIREAVKKNIDSINNQCINKIKYISRMNPLYDNFSDKELKKPVIHIAKYQDCKTLNLHNNSNPENYFLNLINRVRQISSEENFEESHAKLNKEVADCIKNPIKDKDQDNCIIYNKYTYYFSNKRKVSFKISSKNIIKFGEVFFYNMNTEEQNQRFTFSLE